jgi:plasmid stabilization system protein ParE
LPPKRKPISKSFWIYIAERNPQAAAALGEQIFETLKRLAAREMEGPEQWLLSGERVKSWPVPPVRLYYRRTLEALEVIRVHHQSRRPITR